LQVRIAERHLAMVQQQQVGHVRLLPHLWPHHLLHGKNYLQANPLYYLLLHYILFCYAHLLLYLSFRQSQGLGWLGNHPSCTCPWFASRMASIEVYSNWYLLGCSNGWLLIRPLDLQRLFVQNAQLDWLLVFYCGYGSPLRCPQFVLVQPHPNPCYRNLRFFPRCIRYWIGRWSIY